MRSQVRSDHGVNSLICRIETNVINPADIDAIEILYNYCISRCFIIEVF